MGENIFETGDLYPTTKISEIKASKEDPEIAVIDTPGLQLGLYKKYKNQLINAIKSINKINL